MKKLSISLLLLCVTTFAIAGNNNCEKIKQLIAKANKKALASEATGAAFQTADDFTANMAATQLDAATKSYVQDVHVNKMYVAEFGKAAQGKGGDAALMKKADEIGTMLKFCLNGAFAYRVMTPTTNVYKGYQFDGRGENLNTRIMVMLVYNPGDKQQVLFVSIMNDPN